MILISNTNDEPITLKFNVSGTDIDCGEVILTDDEYLYTYVGKIVKSSQLNVKEHSMIEIRVDIKE